MPAAPISTAIPGRDEPQPEGKPPRTRGQQSPHQHQPQGKGGCSCPACDACFPEKQRASVHKKEKRKPCEDTPGSILQEDDKRFTAAARAGDQQLPAEFLVALLSNQRAESII